VLEREMKGRRARAGRRREREEREKSSRFFFRRFSSSLSFCSLLPPDRSNAIAFGAPPRSACFPHCDCSSLRLDREITSSSSRMLEEKSKAVLEMLGKRRCRGARGCIVSAVVVGAVRQPLFLFLVFRECARKSRSPSPPRPRSDCFTLSLARQQTLSHYRMPEEKSRWERKQLTSSRESVAKGQGVIIFAPKTKAVTIDCASRHRARQPSRAFQFYSFSRKALARGRDRCVARVCRGAEGEGRGC